MNNSQFIHVYYQGMHPCSPEQGAYVAALKSWLCEECKSPKPGFGAVDIVIDEERLPQRLPLTFVSGCGLIIARTTFLDSLGRDTVANDLHVGTVSSPGGPIEGWATVRGKASVIVRADSHVSCRRCNACGRTLYFAMGPRYLFPKPSDDHCVFESDLSGLVIRKALWDQIPGKRWSPSTFDSIDVADRPRDGLLDL